jgi:hypothetical protein
VAVKQKEANEQQKQEGKCSQGIRVAEKASLTVEKWQLQQDQEDAQETFIVEESIVCGGS